MKRLIVCLFLGACALTVAGAVFVYFTFIRRPPDGRIEVKQATTQSGAAQNQLLRDQINRGTNFVDKEWRRLATTYYHRRGPLGVVLEKFNWFPGADNTFHADARMPAQLVGLANPGLEQGFPMATLVGLWSEPAIAVLSLEAGTPASYARPGQHLHFFEKSDRIVRLSLPAKDDPKPSFFYLHDARQRGAAVKVFPGEERETFKQSGGQQFYHVLVVESAATHSGAPSVELLTFEAMTLFFTRMVEEGIVCYHVSSRDYDLVNILSDNAAKLGFACVRGHDQAFRANKPGAPISDQAHFTSEWVMVARKPAYLRHLKEPPGYAELMRAQLPGGGAAPYWPVPRPSGQLVMGDGDTSVLRKVRRQ